VCFCLFFVPSLASFDRFFLSFFRFCFSFFSFAFLLFSLLLFLLLQSPQFSSSSVGTDGDPKRDPARPPAYPPSSARRPPPTKEGNSTAIERATRLKPSPPPSSLVSCLLFVGRRSLEVGASSSEDELDGHGLKGKLARSTCQDVWGN
jgi:hypothetical protein